MIATKINHSLPFAVSNNCACIIVVVVAVVIVLILISTVTCFTALSCEGSSQQVELYDCCDNSVAPAGLSLMTRGECIHCPVGKQ